MTAARSTCQNNLKQIGLALHNYHLQRDVFPKGYSQIALNTKTPPGWMAEILPFVEQEGFSGQASNGPVTSRIRPPILKPVVMVVSDLLLPEFPENGFSETHIQPN